MFMQLELHLKINEDAKRKTFSTKNEKKVFPSADNRRLIFRESEHKKEIWQ